MKSILLQLIVCIPIFCFSQIVHIPDNGFKNALIQIGVDTNSDGEISYSEAEAVDSLNINNHRFSHNSISIQNLDGIGAFKNLWYLNCSFHENLSSLELEGLTKLERLEASLTQISTLDLSVCPELVWVHVVHNNLRTIKLNGLNRLQVLRCFSNNLTSLDLEHTPNLTSLSIEFNNFEEIDVSVLPFLSTLDVSRNSLSTLDVSKNIDLEWLFCSHNNLTSLDVSMLHSLNKVNCTVNPLVMLNLKNGQPSKAHSIFLNSNSGAYLKHLCVNEEDVGYWQGRVNAVGINCQVGSHCTILPERGENTITGRAQFIENQSDCGTNLTYAIPYQKFLINSENEDFMFFTDVEGYFNIPLPRGEYKISQDFDKPENFETKPGSITLNLDDGPSTFHQDFCVSTKVEIADVETSIIPLNTARPGFDASYKIIYKNIGSVVLDGEVSLGFPSDKTSFLESSPTHDELIDNNITWFFKELVPQERRIIFVDLNINSPMDSPAVNGGDILRFCANVFIPDLDLQYRADDSACLDQEVVISYDPNDKTCLEGDVITPKMIGEYVHYKIRFENTGTADAVNIVIKDRIDLDNFDINSIRLVDSSHEPTITIENGNVLNFIFEDIYLPFDDESNDGYVVFKIKTLPSLQINDVLENTAEIYFDFNFAIVTNTTKTVIGLDHLIAVNLSKREEVKARVQLMPNPTSRSIRITAEDNMREVIIHSILGDVVDHLILRESTKSLEVDVHKLYAGKYFLKVLFDKTQNVSSFIKTE